MNEQWQELKETIIEMRDNDGTLTQQEVCKFLANLMDVLEKQMSSSENPNKWIPVSERLPENRMFCLITVKITPYGYNSTYEVHIAWFDGRNFIDKFNTDNVIAKRSVVAWQPLPEPYKAESEK